MRLSVLAALLVSLALPGQARPIPGSDFAVGNWSGGGETDEFGAFSHCWVSVYYTSGETLWLGLYGNDTLSVLMSHPEIRYRPGDLYDSWLMLETGLPVRADSEAWDEAFAGMTLAGIDPSIEFLSSGRWLRLLGIGMDDAYDVTGLPEALQMARTCHARNSGSNPFAVAEPQPVEPQPVEPEPINVLPAEPEVVVEPEVVEPEPEPEPQPALGTTPPMPKVPDLVPKPGGGLGTRPGGALGTPAPRPAP